ncbi:MAG: DNA polymerase III subunit delta [Clostridia bacterium]|nr:DNA polymerase III subunit delta [Clostridia bacterium]
MTVENLEKELKQNNLQSLYLLYGEEKFLLENAVKKIKKLFGDLILGINYIQINEDNIDSLISNIETPAFGYPRKLIIVKDSGLFKKEKKALAKQSNELLSKIVDFISENINQIKESNVIVFIENDIIKNDLLSLIEKEGVTCNFERLRPLEIKKRIKAICTAYKVNIDEKTLSFFIETCGTNMLSLINEIRKLIEYAGENGTITKESIDKLSIKEFEAKIFDLTDNLGKRNIKEALIILKELIYNKEPIQKILITLYNHFKKLYISKLAINEKQDILKLLNLKPNQTFLISKYKKQSEYFKLEELRNILGELIDLDKNSKSGLIDINIGLEAILCTYF